MQVIEFFDDTGDLMVVRLPQQGSGEYAAGTQLIVQESQQAFFARDGQILDGFTAGRHTLETRNLPVLTGLIGAITGAKPFRSNVFFVHTKIFTNLGWGTPNPINFRDSELRMVALRAHGSYAMRISKPRVFLTNFVGTRGIETTFAIQDYLRKLVVSRFTEALGENIKSVLDLPAHFSEIAAATKSYVRGDFEQYGLDLVDLIIEAVTPPPEVQAMINKASGIEAQNVAKYQAIASADAMQDAARRGGQAGEAMQAGLGMSMGVAMAQQMAAAMQPAAGVAGARAGAAAGTVDVKQKLKELKSLLDEGLITQADFDEQKKRVLASMV